ncbi:DUF2971 domain-containing protein [Vibrio vulnificus]
MAKNKSLYKFRAFNKGSIELLLNRELWFAKPESLNDPFECQFDKEQLFSDLDGIERIYKDKIAEYADKIINEFNSMGICSFSRTKKNQLMWSHYADDHRGFCIEFKESSLLSNNKVIKSIDVNYQVDLPKLNVINNVRIDGYKINATFDSDIFTKIIGTKYTSWKYEKETRLVLIKSSPLKFLPTDVSSICFGLRMPQKDQNTLVTLLSGSDWKHLEWYQAVKSPGRLTLDFERKKI